MYFRVCGICFKGILLFHRCSVWGTRMRNQFLRKNWKLLRIMTGPAINITFLRIKKCSFLSRAAYVLVMFLLRASWPKLSSFYARRQLRPDCYRKLVQFRSENMLCSTYRNIAQYCGRISMFFDLLTSNFFCNIPL